MKKLLASAALVALLAIPTLARADDATTNKPAFVAPRPSIGAPAVAIVPGKPEIRPEQNKSAAQTATPPAAVAATPAPSAPQNEPKVVGGMNVTQSPSTSQNFTSAPVKTGAAPVTSSAPVNAAPSTVTAPVAHPHAQTMMRGNITAKPAQ